MFRTSNLRGKARFNTIRNFAGQKSAKIKLTTKQLQLIENSPVLVLAEKIELLLVALGNKLTTELYFTVDYSWDEKARKELPNQVQVKAIEKLLNQLPFPFFKDSITQKNRQTGHDQNFVWFQVSVNTAVSQFMKEFPDDLTEFEEGVLYGFPLSAIRAFSGLIKPGYDKPNAASYYLAGVMSADFWEDEQEYYQMWWERLRKLSPKIVEEAEKHFSDTTS